MHVQGLVLGAGEQGRSPNSPDADTFRNTYDPVNMTV